MYKNFIKRCMDFLLSLCGIIVLSPILLVLVVLVRVKLGKPALFTQERPGKDEKIFKLYKFRSMTDERDEKGELLPDESRLTRFGKLLRSTSLDELPELVNILKGEMSVVGPRPLLVRDMVFMTRKQRRRHEVRGGLTGLAQVMGRNAIDWETKLELDLKYIDNITFLGDMKIIFRTMITAFIKREGITEAEMATALDYGDYLLRNQKVVKQEYERKQKEAKGILKRK